eukprot:110877-Pelagomonas_calceolata.AAC.1
MTPRQLKRVKQKARRHEKQVGGDSQDLAQNLEWRLLSVSPGTSIVQIHGPPSKERLQGLQGKKASVKTFDC